MSRPNGFSILLKRPESKSLSTFRGTITFAFWIRFSIEPPRWMLSEELFTEQPGTRQFLLSASATKYLRTLSVGVARAPWRILLMNLFKKPSEWIRNAFALMRIFHQLSFFARRLLI